MHPEHIAALARQRTRERTPNVRLRMPPPADRDWSVTGTEMARRVRRQLGSMLLDVGVHLLVAT